MLSVSIFREGECATLFGKKPLWFLRSKRRLNATQRIALTFLGIILLGSILLTLPAASRSGQSVGYLTALFTSTSATCVTGLVLGDTWTLWSGFGQVVILALIEIGGLGFMSAASLVIFLLRRKVGLKQRMLMAQALSLDEMDGVVHLQKIVISGSLLIQFTGAVILMLRFLPEYGLRRAVIWGVFHAISAFCNAGFDIFGAVAPGQSVAYFNGDAVVCLTLMALIILGGLGFFVWEEILSKRSFRKLSVYTKLVLLTSAVLILSGAAVFLALEWNNPETLGNMPVWQKILNALFQSVTMRTAGFASFDQAKLTEAGKVVGSVLMLIGGSSGSTAGGIKTVTLVVLMLFLYNRLRGRDTVTVFRRTVPGEKVMDAMTIASVVITLCVAGAIFICVSSGIGFVDSLFEAASALGTVGVTAGVTGSLSLAAKIMIIVFMYFGRVGILTISLGFLIGDKAVQRYQYANTNLLIG
jgi:trk system potassium uptake protein TrkH